MKVTPPSSPATQLVQDLVARARIAQRAYEKYDQAAVDEVVTAVGWAIVEPARNQELADFAVADTGLGNAADKFIKNRRKTMGLLRDLRGVKTVGVIAEYPELGLVEIARPVGVVAAVTPSTNPAATPANKIINALKGRNAVILSPSPKGWNTCAKLLEFIHLELDRLGAARDLVQMLPAPVTKETSAELLRQADLVVATGSRANVRAAYVSGTPAFGVGAGNVVSIVDETADLADAAQLIRMSKTFDNATSCSSENSIVVLGSAYGPMLSALQKEGAVMLDAGEKAKLQAVMFPGGKLSPATTAQSAGRIAEIAGLSRDELRDASILMIEESGVGAAHPFSGEKLSPVLAVYRARDFEHAMELTRSIYAYQGAGHSVGMHSSDDARILRLGLELPVCRVIVNQAHSYATGGSFDNGLPFSLSMGCGTWGRNNFSDNLTYRHYLNITRISRTISPREVTDEELFGPYRRKHGV
jgi:sulfoacetaldehyde dehydrogenase